MRATLATCFLAFPLLVACGGESQPPAQTPATSSAGAAGGEDGEAQAARGAKLYGEHCATCHGNSGEGGDGPRVVGKDALPLDPRPDQKFRKVQFHTALDVGQFVVQNMPPKGPKLAEKDYWDILAFDLKANGVPVAGKHVDATTAGGIKLH